MAPKGSIRKDDLLAIPVIDYTDDLARLACVTVSHYPLNARTDQIDCVNALRT